MPLDPQAQKVLEQMAALGLPPTHTMTVAEVRQALSAIMVKGTPEPVGRVEVRQIPGPGGEIPVRIYWPEGDGPFPLLVYFHGGGWIRGDLETHDAPCRALTNGARGIVVSVEYRLAPEHKFPAAVEDCDAATLWAADNAARLNGDPSRLAVGGDSAGGNLAAVVALLARDRGGPKLAFQLLIYPVTDYAFDTPSYLENASGYWLTRDAMIWYWGHYLTRESEGTHPHAAPLRAEDLSGLPPAFVLTAEYDPLRDEGEAYAERLRAAGVPVTLKRYPGVIHGFVNMADRIDQGKRALQDASAALRDAFAAVPAR